MDDVPCEKLAFDIHLMVQNIGNLKGDHVVMAFWNPPPDIVHQGAPIKQLVGFRRIYGLDPQETTQVKMNLNVCDHFSFVNSEGKKLIRAGFHNLLIGQTEHVIEFQYKSSIKGYKYT